MVLVRAINQLIRGVFLSFVVGYTFRVKRMLARQVRRIVIELKHLQTEEKYTLALDPRTPAYNYS